MADIDPTQIQFNEIVHREHVADMLAVETPPWDIAVMEDLPLQRQRISREAAQVVCRSLLTTADYADALFIPTFQGVTNMARWQAVQQPPKGPHNIKTMVSDAAFLVSHFPNPGDVLQFHEAMEYGAERRRDREQHQEFIATARVGRTGLSEQAAVALTAYAEASLSLGRRRHAFESVLDVVYGDRYASWRSMPDLL